MYKIIPILIILIYLTACTSEKPVEQNTEPLVDTIQKVSTVIDTTTLIDTLSRDTITIDSSKIPQRIDKPTLTAPKIKFEHTVYDYDTLVAGEEITHEFRFTNEGDRPLEIKKVEASCGCTEPAYPFVLIAKGEQNSIRMKFNSTGKSGQHEANITVYTNEPKAHTLILDGYIKEK